MNILTKLFYPFFQPSVPINPLRYIELKWICVQLFMVIVLSYLMGAYKVFLIVLPLYILATLYFTVIIIFKNREFFIQYGFGDATYRALSVSEKETIYNSSPEKIKILSWLLWILHIIPLIIFMIWFDKVRKGVVPLDGIDDSWLYIRKNNLQIAFMSIGVAMLFLFTLSKNLYGMDSSYYIFAMPVLLLAIAMTLY